MFAHFDATMEVFLMTRITKAPLDNIITALLLPNYSKLNLRDKADLYAIVGGLIEWGELDKRRRRQLRKLAFEVFDRDLSEELKIVLSDHIKDLEIELDGYLKEYKIS